jgi:hypothetical protein
VCLDRHFLERRHVPVPGRSQDAHIGRAIVHRADEVLGIARHLEAVEILERDAVRAFGVDRHLGGEHAIGSGQGNG